MELLVHSWVIDNNENIFKRKGNYLIKRTDAVDCITEHLRIHLKDLGIADMELRRLMRDFDVDAKKALKYAPYRFNNNL